MKELFHGTGVKRGKEEGRGWWVWEIENIAGF